MSEELENNENEGQEKYFYLEDGRVDYIETPEGTYKFTYVEEDLDFIDGPDGKYEFFYTEEGEVDNVETPGGNLEFYHTRTGKIDSIKTEGGEFIFYYSDDGKMDIEAVGDINDELMDKLMMFGIV